MTAGIGVTEGYSGHLRTGLPWQSVSDGHKLQHTPNILNVIIEASIDAINEVLKKNQSLRNLVDNGWLKLLQMDDEGIIANRYKSNLNWESISCM
ncbi:putative inorganic carbon transporter subunit DabA [Flavobacterium sp. Arc3]|uniref:putative inorganic carbon transporter subunit DabA n=1 Tax=Flavobacterium sp. Arc3 TaxID=3046686 RepID=UPI00352CE42D